MFFYAVTGSKIKSNLPGAGWRRGLDRAEQLFLRSKNANEPRHPLHAAECCEIAAPVCGLVRNDGAYFCEAKMQTSLVTASAQIPYPSSRHEMPGLAHSVVPPFQTKPTSLGFRLDICMGDCQEVNCPKGKRSHPGVHQSADWFAMTARIFAKQKCKRA